MSPSPEKVLVIGATGFVGSAIARHFRAAGHAVSGLARTANATAQLAGTGICAVAGDLDSRLENVLAAAAHADTVIFAAQVSPDTERRAVSALLAHMADAQKTFVFISGTGVFLQRTEGAWSQDCFAEDAPFPVEPLAVRRVEVEAMVRTASAQGLRAMVVRPPLIWGTGDHGHVAMTYQSVAATGSACYVGSGLACYSNVHVDDVAALVALAAARGEPGRLYHCPAGETPNRWIAEAVAQDLGCGTRSLTMQEAAEVWGEFGALIMGSSSRSRSVRSHDELGWMPRHTDMLSMVGEPRLRAMATSSNKPRETGP